MRDTASDKANILCIFSPLPPETRISNISMHLWSTLLVKRSSDLAERFHYLFLADVPQMNLSNRNEVSGEEKWGGTEVSGEGKWGRVGVALLFCFPGVDSLFDGLYITCS